jgi:hypothetical protein
MSNQNQFQKPQGFGATPQQQDPRQWELAAGLAALPDSKLTNAYMTEEQPEGQMVSGHYVAPSWTQNLAALGKNALGGQMYRQRDAQTQALIEALRQNNDGGAQAFPVDMG